MGRRCEPATGVHTPASRAIAHLKAEEKDPGADGKGPGPIAAAYLHLVKPPALGLAFLERPRGRDAGGSSQHGCHWLVYFDSKRTLRSPDVYGGDTGARG